MEQGRLDAAEPIMRKQFDIVLDQATTTPLNTFVQTRRLGGLLIAMGKLDQAQAVLDERIHAVTEHFGGDASPARLQFLATAASLFEDAGEWERASPYRCRAYQALMPTIWISRPWENPHAFVANLRRLGKPAAVAEALEIAKSLLDAARAATGVRSPLVHDGAAEYIRCLTAAGRVKEACAAGEDLMAQVHAETADWQYRVSSVRQAQSEALLAAGRFLESEQLARAELARRSRIRGWAHPLTWEPLRTQAATLQGLGRSAEVLPLCRAALAEQLEGSSMASGATLAVVQTLAEVLLSVGESAGAESMLRRTLGERLADPGTVRRPMVELRCLLARAVAQGTHPADAAEELSRFESTLKDSFGTSHPWTRRVRDERARLGAPGKPN